MRLALVGVVLSGCLAPSFSALAPAEIEASGKHRFEGDPPRIFQATLGALRGQGYGIAYADQASGMIQTNRRLSSVAYRQLSWFRQYQVTVTPQGSGAAEVIALPRLFEGDREISAGESWDLDEERRRWFALFSEIARLLSAPQVMPSQPPAL